MLSEYQIEYTIPTYYDGHSVKTLLPRQIFIKAHQDMLDDLSTISYVKGIARNTLGEATQAIHEQMIWFQHKVAEAYLADGVWLPMSKEERRARRKTQKDAGKVNSFAELAKHIEEMFGN